MKNLNKKLFTAGVVLSKGSRIMNHPLSILGFRLTYIGAVVLAIMAGSGNL